MKPNIFLRKESPATIA